MEFRQCESPWVLQNQKIRVKSLVALEPLRELTSPAPRNSTFCSASGLLVAFCAASSPAKATEAVPAKAVQI